MLIACLGWGSLVWDPRELPIQEKWFHDGPFLPLEFARQSKDGRLTLVIVSKNETKVRSLWTLFSVPTITEAREALCSREEIPDKNMERDIAVWPNENLRDPVSVEIARWAKNTGIDVVIWTALSPKIIKKGKTVNRAPTIAEAITHIHELPHEQKRNAERYVRMAPKQIDTPFRRRFEAEFGWAPFSKI
jgi:hypothetical protein